MNTHTIIFKFSGKILPEISCLKKHASNYLTNSKIEYFARNGRRLYSNPQGLMENLSGKFFIKFSFQHLLQLDTTHALAVIRAALELGMVKKVRQTGNGLDVMLA